MTKTNEEALELLQEFAETASKSVMAAVWAEAFLTEGGVPTWDAVKSVATLANQLSIIADKVGTLDLVYDEISPF